MSIMNHRVLFFVSAFPFSSHYPRKVGEKRERTIVLLYTIHHIGTNCIKSSPNDGVVKPYFFHV